jgi:hypothetical protein
MRSNKRPRAHDTRHSAADDTFAAEVQSRSMKCLAFRVCCLGFIVGRFSSKAASNF